jgi:hypothetical protein
MEATACAKALRLEECDVLDKGTVDQHDWIVEYDSGLGSVSSDTVLRIPRGH